VDRGDLDRRSALLDAQRAVLSLFIPPAQEQGDVGDLRRAEGDHLLVQRLQVGDLAAVAAQVEPHDDALEGLLG